MRMILHFAALRTKCWGIIRSRHLKRLRSGRLSASTRDLTVRRNGGSQSWSRSITARSRNFLQNSRYFLATAAFWLGSSMVVYALGWSIGWVVRGFRKTG